MFDKELAVQCGVLDLPGDSGMADCSQCDNASAANCPLSMSSHRCYTPGLY